MRKLIFMWIFCVCAVVTTASSAGEKLKIGWVFAMANAPVLVAQEKGFFKDEGVDVEILQFSSGPLLHQALSAGELDMAYIGSPPVYHWFARGLDSRILAKVNYGQASVITRKDSGINNINDLHGKKLAGVKKGSGMDVLLRGYILGESGKMNADKDLNVISMPPGNMDASVEQKVVDAAFIWEPFTTRSLFRGNTKVIMDMNKEIPKYPWYVVMAMPETLKNKRDSVIKALRAHKNAVDYLNSSPEAGNDIIAAAFKLGEVDDDKGVKHSANEMVTAARTRMGWEYELRNDDVKFVQRLMNYSFSLGYIKKELKATDIIDTTFMAEASK